VHHALSNIIEPIFDRTFIYDSYACRKGKGTHKAVERFTQFCRKYSYVLKCDIMKYFPSIDHEILYGLIAKKIRCPKTLWLIKKIIDASGEQEPVITYFEGDETPLTRRKGLPIGNLTSQFFGNIYLDGFDHFVKETLQCKAYIRYVDDFVVLADDKQWLHKVKDQMAEYLVQLRLKLHPRKCIVFPIKDGTDFLGYRIFPTHRLLRNSNVKRTKRRLKKLQVAYSSGEIPLEKARASIHSWIAHASWADTYHLRRKLLGNTAFVRVSQP
jgi:retron-type reverse transcriptase